MRVLICGSRDFSDRGGMSRVFSWLETGHRVLARDMLIIHGGAAGADRMAGELAQVWGWAVRSFPADWSRHGKGAGTIRNQQMLDEGNPDMVLAFVSKPLAESRGTADMVRRATAAGIPVHVVEALANAQ